MSRLRLALYHPWVYLTSGIERSIAELLRRSRHDWVVYTHHHEPAATYPELAGFQVVELAPRVSVRRSFGPLLKATATIAASRLPADGATGLLVSSEGLGDFILARNRLPAVAYCHTPLKIVHDPAARSALTRLDARKALVARALGPPFSAADRLAWRRYRHVFVNSRETAERVARARLAQIDKVEVLHPGVDVQRYHDTGAGRETFFLAAGRVMWQKNIELALDALAAADLPGVELVVAGGVDVKSRPYLAALRERARDLPVRFVVDPSDEILVDLYSRCLAVLFTARNEDFGIVPLEAMACGAPVLAVDAGGPRESVLPERTGWLLPADPQRFAAVMRQVAIDPAALQPMRAAARARAAAFGWEPFAARIDDVMEQVVTGVAVSPPAPR